LCENDAWIFPEQFWFETQKSRFLNRSIGVSIPYLHATFIQKMWSGFRTKNCGKNKNDLWSIWFTSRFKKHHS